MRTDWVMRSFPEEEKKQPPRQEDKPISPAVGLGIVAFLMFLPFVGKLFSAVLLVFGTIFRFLSGILKEFFRAAPDVAAFLTGICIGVRLYYRFRRNKNTAEEAKAQQPSADVPEEEIPAPQAHHAIK